MGKKNDEEPSEEREQEELEQNPFRQMAELWSQGTRAYTEALQSFVEATGATARKIEEEGIDGEPDAAAELRENARAWSEAIGKLSVLQPQFLAGLLEDQATKVRVDAGTFSQLERLANTNWEDEVDRFSDLQLDLGERLASADSSRLGGLLQSMTREYLSDLEAIRGQGLELDLDRLSEAWKKISSGEDDDEARRTVDRLLGAMATKAKYGPEYYADPKETKVGQSPREVVHEVAKIRLFRYLPAPDAPPRRGQPVLLVYSVINKPYILDLVPGYSFVEHLLDAGLDVYLIEWGAAVPDDHATTLDSYIDPGIHECVQRIKALTGSSQVSLFGHCIGGNLALLYAALYPEEAHKLVTLTTPITAAEGGVVALWTDRELFPVDKIIDTFGVMPAKLIRYTFMAIKPYYEVLKWKLFLENLGNDQVMALFYPVDRWANENVDIPGEVFRKFIVEIFHEDRFRLGRTKINDREAKLESITCPLLNLAAVKDWIVVPESARILNDIVSSEDRRFTLIDGAHVSIMIDPRARRHWAEMSDFLLEGADSSA